MSSNSHFSFPFTPRFIRLRDAPFYLGMDKNRFNADVRPTLTEIPIGQQGIAFDRNELDAWADDYVRRLGNSKTTTQEKTPWQKKSRASLNGATAGTSTKLSKADAFAKALAQATSKKRKPS